MSKEIRKMAGKAIIGPILGIAALIGVVTGAIFWVQRTVKAETDPLSARLKVVEDATLIYSYNSTWMKAAMDQNGIRPLKIPDMPSSLKEIIKGQISN